MRLRAKVIVSVGAIIAVLVGGILALPIGFVTSNLAAMRDVAEGRRDAEAELATALPAAEQLVEKQHAQLRRRYHLPTPTYSAQELKCVVKAVGTVYTTESYSQECYLRSVELFAARDGLPRCRETYVPGGLDPRRVRTSAAVLRMTADGVAHRRWDSRCGGAIVLSPEEETTRALAVHLPRKLTSTQTWMVVRIDAGITISNLGCLPWTLLFCEPPGGPYLPDSIRHVAVSTRRSAT